MISQLVLKFADILVNSTQSYHDIPFAQYERFAKPVPHPGWVGCVRDGTRRTSCQPQTGVFQSEHMSQVKNLIPYPTSLLAQIEAAQADAHEGTLHLSVVTPSINQSGLKPVMVWLHGGAWAFGGACQYDPTPLVSLGDVVVVVLSYRLDVFGFLFGNWAIYDMIAGLEWIGTNIGAFGGDSNNITIIGESAGAFAVEALLLTPLANGLFHRAIVQSGTLRGVTPFLTIEQNECYQYLMNKFQVEDIASLRAAMGVLNMGELLSIGSELRRMGFNFTNTIDNEVFVTPVQLKSPFTSRVPLLIGTNDSEAGWLVPTISRLPNVAPVDVVYGYIEGRAY